jgi:glycosyltransferase involved in cell wall biosynthesis
VSANPQSEGPRLQVGSAPLVSFCLATYNRPERLRNVLASIYAQTISNYEVIVSDNDPEQSSRGVVESMGDVRFKYFSNSVNVGMVKNFNVALNHAGGQYVLMITDDDPIYPYMLSTLVTLAADYPGYGAYYGACDVALENSEVASAYATEEGLISFLAPVAHKAVRVYRSPQFLSAFFKRSIFPYMLWSTGMVRRDIAVQIGGMPDYGSPFLTDFTYLALAGEEAGFVAINESLGYQAVHGQNSGFTNPHSLHVALHGSHGLLTERLSKRRDWDALRPDMEAYLGVYIVGHIVAMRRHFKRTGDAQQRREYESLKRSLFEIGYIRKLSYRYHLSNLMAAVPFLRRVYTRLKKLRPH